MMIHVTAAALVSECKANSFPASVDSIPTSAGKEDHVSMGPIAARKLARNVEMLETVLAIEFLAAAQALDLRRPLRTLRPILEEAAPAPPREGPLLGRGPPGRAGDRRGASRPRRRPLTISRVARLIRRGAAASARQVRGGEVDLRRAPAHGSASSGRRELRRAPRPCRTRFRRSAGAAPRRASASAVRRGRRERRVASSDETTR